MELKGIDSEGILVVDFIRHVFVGASIKAHKTISGLHGRIVWNNAALASG